MRAAIYAGPLAYWNLRQCAFAAKRYPHFPPTQEGLAMLQEQWFSAGQASPPRHPQESLSLSWASAALRDIESRQMKYEQVPA